MIDIWRKCLEGILIVWLCWCWPIGEKLGSYRVTVQRVWSPSDHPVTHPGTPTSPLTPKPLQITTQIHTPFPVPSPIATMPALKVWFLGT